MIWGEMVNAVRHLNYEFISEFKIEPKIFTQDLNLNAQNFPYPKEVDDFEEWNEYLAPAELEELLPLHPVERVLVEGPVLPIQKVQVKSKQEVDQMFGAVLSLQKQWCMLTKNSRPEQIEFLEKSCQASALRLSHQLGFLKLNALPS